MTRITLKSPDDWHLHVRDGAAMACVVGHTAARFQRAIIMPNLVPPVTSVSQALSYRERVLASAPVGAGFRPLMTLYLTDNTSAEEVRRAAASEHVYAFKLYPAGATTNSDRGVTDIAAIYGALAAMQDNRVPLLVHGEVVDPDIDVFDREAVFIETTLAPLRRRFPSLPIVLEHITTVEGVDFVNESEGPTGGTITAHHLLINRNDLFAGGIRPHHYCLPIAKRERHRLALVQAATSGESRFFLGTDSAPHARAAKEASCGCAGIYTSHAAIELYAEAFEAAGALDRLEAFASLNGPAFYALEPNRGELTLEKQAWPVPAAYEFGNEELVPFRAGEPISWRLVATQT